MRSLSALLVAAAAGGLVGLGCGGSGGSSGGGGAVTPGASARDFIDDAVYDTLVVEVDHVQGQAPSATALALLEQRLEERCSKPGGVTIVVDDAIPSPGLATYSVAQNRALEQQHRDLTSSGTTAVFYVLYLDGRSDQDGSSGSVLGWAHGPSSVAIFRETIQSTSSLLVTPAEVEGAVLVHEAGHILGLVATGTPMVTNHQDPAHPGHDVDDGCIMHWQIETSDIITLVQNRGSLPTQFDARCIEDLRARGGL
jgi:hypothetical protein